VADAFGSLVKDWNEMGHICLLVVNAVLCLQRLFCRKCAGLLEERCANAQLKRSGDHCAYNGVYRL
jgi:hypothetical protein